MLDCKKIFGRNYFESYSEFYLALCMAAEMGRREDKLDMSGMVVDKSLLSKSELNYFKYLIGTGCIYLGDKGLEVEDTIDPKTVEYYLDMKGITELKDKLVENRPEEYYWSVAWATANYLGGPRDFRIISKTGNVLMHIVAHILVSEFLGEIQEKPFEIEFDKAGAKNTYFYVNLVSCSNTMEWFKERVTLKIDYGESSVDINYSIFCNNGMVAGKYKKWSIGDKHKFMEKYGMCVGSIVVLWDRTGMCPSNVAGKIVSATIARIDEIGNDFLGVTTIALNKTKEETRIDYESIDQNKRYLFRDMLSFKPLVQNKVLSLYEVGIDNYFYDESQLITFISKTERTTKRITVEGEESEVDMSGVDALYWLMCQYGFEFDRELFRAQYSDGKDLLWDLYGEDTNEF